MNKEKNREKVKKWKVKNPEKAKAQVLRYRAKHIESVKLREKSYNQRVRMLALVAYSGEVPKCACCGEIEIKFLSIDHINGGGTKHRNSILGPGKKGGNINVWLRKNNYPEGFQVLCHNCNMAKGFYRCCPHSSKK